MTDPTLTALANDQLQTVRGGQFRAPAGLADPRPARPVEAGLRSEPRPAPAVVPPDLSRSAARAIVQPGPVSGNHAGAGLSRAAEPARRLPG